MRGLLRALAQHRADILKALQVVALFWIAYELHALVENIYTGPGPLSADVTAMEAIAESLDRVAKAIILK